MNHTKSLLLFAMAISLAACSSQQFYDAVQQNRLQNCENVAPGLYEECVASHSQSYEDYERGRQEVIN